MEGVRAGGRRIPLRQAATVGQHEGSAKRIWFFPKSWVEVVLAVENTRRLLQWWYAIALLEKFQRFHVACKDAGVLYLVLCPVGKCLRRPSRPWRQC